MNHFNSTSKKVEKYGRRIRSFEQFQPSSEAYAASTCRGFGTDIERAVTGLEKLYRTTETPKVTKTMCEKSTEKLSVIEVELVESSRFSPQLVRSILEEN